ncbi:response regulator, partial [Gammaproteobacteria bacterium]|nr:response regulator [Gammaproteobacteria bacterium]
MKERILIVEDEPDIRATLEYNLHRENYLTDSVGTISEAEKILKETEISIILLDLMLPDGSGLDLCRKLKSEKES